MQLIQSYGDIYSSLILYFLCIAMADKTTKIPMERQIHPVVMSPFTSLLRGEVTLEYVSTIPKTDERFIIPNIDNPPPDAK